MKLDPDDHGRDGEGPVLDEAEPMWSTDWTEVGREIKWLWDEYDADNTGALDADGDTQVPKSEFRKSFAAKWASMAAPLVASDDGAGLSASVSARGDASDDAENTGVLDKW